MIVDDSNHVVDDIVDIVDDCIHVVYDSVGVIDDSAGVIDDIASAVDDNPGIFFHCCANVQPLCCCFLSLPQSLPKAEIVHICHNNYHRHEILEEIIGEIYVVIYE